MNSFLVSLLFVFTPGFCYGAELCKYFRFLIDCNHFWGNSVLFFIHCNITVAFNIPNCPPNFDTNACAGHSLAYLIRHGGGMFAIYLDLDFWKFKFFSTLVCFPEIDASDIPKVNPYIMKEPKILSILNPASSIYFYANNTEVSGYGLANGRVTQVQYVELRIQSKTTDINSRTIMFIFWQRFSNASTQSKYEALWIHFCYARNKHISKFETDWKILFDEIVSRDWHGPYHYQ